MRSCRRKLRKGTWCCYGVFFGCLTFSPSEKAILCYKIGFSASWRFISTFFCSEFTFSACTRSFLVLIITWELTAFWCWLFVSEIHNFYARKVIFRTHFNFLCLIIKKITCWIQNCDWMIKIKLTVFWRWLLEFMTVHISIVFCCTLCCCR
jgi:hypothetical protein